MSRPRQILRHLGMEVPLFLYMMSSFLKYPVFQNLIFEKVCLDRYHDKILCENVTAYYEDHHIQQDANHVYFLSSITLIAPSVISTLFLGSACDMWSTKFPLIIPFLGLIVGTIGYIVQTVHMQWNVYFLLISDFTFGICGGYTGIIATTMAYGMKTTKTRHRSIRIAGLEGAIGLGGTIGYALSGTIRQAVGYAWAFVIMLVLQVLAFIYIILFAREVHQTDADSMISQSTADHDIGIATKVLAHIVHILREFKNLLVTDRMYRTLLNLNLLALGMELLVFAGLTDIQYSFLRYKLGWGDKEYGWFSGMSYGTTTAAVFLIYPFLRMRGFTDSLLGSGGIFMKIISLVVFAFVNTPVMAYSVTVLTIGNRFVSTGFRSFIGSLVYDNEHGKVFSLIAFLEGVTSLIATSIYNNLYPKTLPIFPGLMILASAVCLIPCLAVLLYSDVVVRRQTTRETNEPDPDPEITSNERQRQPQQQESDEQNR